MHGWGRGRSWVWIWGGRGGLDRGSDSFRPRTHQPPFSLATKTFFQKYKKKKKIIFFSAIFLFGQLIYWFRPSFDNFRSRAGFVQRERRKNNEEWDEKWPCVRFKKSSKNWKEIKKKKCQNKEKVEILELYMRDQQEDWHKAKFKCHKSIISMLKGNVFH